MENNNKNQKVLSNSIPILVKIIAIITMVFGFLLVLSPLHPMTSVHVTELIKNVTIGFALAAGGIGLLIMKRWGLYVFSIAILAWMVESLLEIWPVWVTSRLLGVWAFVLISLYLIYWIGSLFYLWKIRNRFKQ